MINNPNNLNLDTTFQLEGSQNHQIYKSLMIASWVVMIFGLGLSIIFYFQLPPLIPIFYSLSEDSAQLGQKFWIFLPSALGLLINSLHSFLITWLKNYDEFLLRLWTGITLVWQLLLLAIIVRIILLVT